MKASEAQLALLHHVRHMGLLKTCGCADEHALFGADVEGIKLEISILQSQLNSTNSFTSQSLTEN